MAPEQVRGQKVDARTDVYAFSVSMFEILTGTRPFPEDPDKFRKMAIHLNREPANPRERNRNIPIALEHILLRGMAQGPRGPLSHDGRHAQGHPHRRRGIRRANARPPAE